MSELAKIVCAKIVNASEKAIQISHKGVTAWIPKSMIEYQRKQGDEITFEIPEWLAETKQLDYE